MYWEELHDIFVRYKPIADEQELWWLVQRLKALKPFETVIEIGVSGGGSLKIWEQLLPPETGLLIGVDIDFNSPSLWHQGSEPIDNNIKMIKSNRKVYMVYGNSVDPYTVSHVKSILNHFSRQADFLYIDGHHEYFEVSNDYRNYSTYVRSGGIIAFHDVGTQWVNKVFEESDGKKEKITLAHGIGIIYK